MKLATIRTHALSLEAVTEEPHHTYSSFRVRGKIFATLPPVGEDGVRKVVLKLPELVKESLRRLTAAPSCRSETGTGAAGRNSTSGAWTRPR